MSLPTRAYHFLNYLCFVFEWEQLLRYVDKTLFYVLLIRKRLSTSHYFLSCHKTGSSSGIWRCHPFLESTFALLCPLHQLWNHSFSCLPSWILEYDTQMLCASENVFQYCIFCWLLTSCPIWNICDRRIKIVPRTVKFYVFLEYLSLKNRRQDSLAMHISCWKKTFFMPYTSNIFLLIDNVCLIWRTTIIGNPIWIP